MKILFGSIVVDARGRLNGHVFKKTAFGNSISALALPRNNSSYMLNPALQRNVAIMRKWSELTEQQRTDWNNFAQLNPIKNKFGVLRNISGRAMFVKCSQMFRFPSIDYPASDILSSTNPPTEVLPVSVNALTGLVTFNTVLLNDSFQLVLYYQRVQSSNMQPLTNKWVRSENHIVSSIGDFTPPANIFLLVGAPVSSQRYFVKFKIINASGWGKAEFVYPLPVV